MVHSYTKVLHSVDARVSGAIFELLPNSDLHGRLLYTEFCFVEEWNRKPLTLALTFGGIFWRHTLVEPYYRNDLIPCVCTSV